jgi:hypothetical protein
MKSEDRHKLQKNELADYLAKAVEKVKPYQNAILGGIILVLVFFLSLHWWNSESAATAETANTLFYTASESNEPGDLVKVAEQFPESKMANVASLMAADIYLSNGCNQQYMNKDGANTELGKAADLYQGLLPKLKDNLLLAQATFGLARTKECQNDLPEAQKRYAEVVEKWPDGPYGVLASRRLADLKRTSTKELYDRFAKFDPQPFKDDSFLRGKLPSFDPSSLPKEGPVYTPGSFEEKLKGNSETKEPPLGESLLKDKPIEGDQPVKDENKADEKKSEEAAPVGSDQPAPVPATPAEGEKPATTPEEKAPEAK